MFGEESHVILNTLPVVITSPPLGDVTRNHLVGVAVGVYVEVLVTVLVGVRVGVSVDVLVGVGVNGSRPKFTVAVPPADNITGSTLLSVVLAYPLGAIESTRYNPLDNPSKL